MAVLNSNRYLSLSHTYLSNTLEKRDRGYPVVGGLPWGREVSEKREESSSVLKIAVLAWTFLTGRRGNLIRSQRDAAVDEVAG